MVGTLSWVFGRCKQVGHSQALRKELMNSKYYNSKKFYHGCLSYFMLTNPRCSVHISTGENRH